MSKTLNTFIEKIKKMVNEVKVYISGNMADTYHPRMNLNRDIIQVNVDAYGNTTDAPSSITKCYRIMKAAFKAAIRREDVFICPICKSELIDKKCPKGHEIVW